MTRTITFLFCVTAWCLIASFVYAENTKAQTVLRNLWSALTENYPMMEYAGALDDRWLEEFQSRIKDVDDFQTAMEIINQLVDRLHDYHTSLHWDGRAINHSLPLHVGFIGEKIVVLDANDSSGIQPGDILQSVDGTNTLFRFHDLMKTAKGATDYAKADTACKQMLEGEPGSSATLVLSNENAENYTVEMQHTGGLHFQHDQVLTSEMIGNETGYIKIAAFGGFSEQDFDQCLEAFQDTPNLIVDVRDNRGGSDHLAELVIGRFIEQPVLCSISFIRNPGTDIYKKMIATAMPRGAWQYQGQVIVLINQGCASATEHFVSGMVEAHATLVGTPTTGACGWSKPIDLGHGVTLHCSLTFPMHGKVPSPLHGMKPHHLVEPTIEDIRAGCDTVLEFAKKL